MSARSLALAGGIVLAITAHPVAANSCSEFWLALALEDAASNVTVEAQRNAPREFLEKGSLGEASAEHEAAPAASIEATDRVEGAMIAVRRTVADEAAATIDAVHTARKAARRAQATAHQ